MAVDNPQGTERGRYDLSTITSATDVSPGTSILVVGPPKTGKWKLGLRILAPNPTQRQGSIVVTTRDSAGRIIEEYTQITQIHEDAALGVIDCVSHQPGDANRTDDIFVKYAQSPADMTGIGVHFSELLKEFRGDRGFDYNRVMVDSLSTLLMYHEFQTVFRFLHVFTRRVDDANALGVFVVNSTAHENQKVNTLLQLFDALLKVEESSDGSQPDVHLKRV